MLLDIEVWNRGAEMHADCRRQCAGADMRLHLEAVGFRHGRDLAGLQKAAGIADIRLKNVNGARFQNVAEAIPGIDALANGHPLGDGAGDLYKRPDVTRIGRFLDIGYVVLLDRMAKPYRVVWSGP